MILQRIKLPVFFYVFVPIQQVKVAKESMLSTRFELRSNYQPKHAILGLSSSCHIHPLIICLLFEILQPNLLHRLSEYI